MNNQRGFFGIGVLIAILVSLVVLGGGAYFLMHQGSPSPTLSDNTLGNLQTLPTNNDQTQTTTNMPAQTTTFQVPQTKTYTNVQYGFSVQYPNDLTLKTGSQISPSGGPDNKILELSFSGSNNDTGTLSVIVDSYPTDVANCLVTPQSSYLSYLDQGVATINGTSFHSFSDSSTGDGITNSTRVYTAVRGSICYSIAKSINTTNTNGAEITGKIDPIVQSFRFIGSASTVTGISAQTFAASPTLGPAPLTVKFSNLPVTAAEEDLNFGDGTPGVSNGFNGCWPINGKVPATCSQPVRGQVTHTYTKPGTYTAVLTGTMSNGELGRVTITITH